jgi:GINS complex subunit 1
MTSSLKPSGATNPFPSAGRELLLELKRQGTHLPAYNTKLVRACFHDLQQSVHSLQQEVQAVAGNTNTANDDANANADANKDKPSMASRPSILFHNASIQRHKRCLLAYHKHRMELLKQHNGNNGDGGHKHPHEEIPLTNATEVEFAKEFQDLRASYASAVFDLDLVPPTSHMVQVRVLRDLQEVVLESGRSVSFTKGSWLYLPRSDVLEFLQGGVLELMDGEEVDF